jgi:hypothetical protein
MKVKYLKEVFSLLLILVFVGCNHPKIHEAIQKGDTQSLIKALKRGDNVNGVNEKGKTPLYEAVKKCDTAAVRILLEYNPLMAGLNIIEYAVLNVIPSDSISKWSKEDQNYPSVKVLHQIMDAVREREFKWKRIDLDGILTINLEMGDFNENTGSSSFTQSISLDAGGKSYDIYIARKETEFVNIEKTNTSTNWNVVLMPGSKYRIKGFLIDDGTIEATYLSLEKTSEGKEKMTYSIINFLYSTKQVIDSLVKDWNKKK